MSKMNEANAMNLGEVMKRNEKPAATRGQAQSTGGLGRVVFWLLTLAVLVLGLGPRAAFAQSANCSPGTPSAVAVAMPASVTVPRDAPVGTVLGSLVYTLNTTNYFNCTVSGSYASGMVFETLSMTKAGTTATLNGKAYNVWNTNVPGVGVAIGVNPYVSTCGSRGWQDLGKPSGTFPSPWSGGVCTQNGSVTNGGQALLALVKTGPITAGTVSGLQFEGASVTGPGLTGPFTIGASGHVLFSLTPTIINVAACTTPNVTVNMGSTMQSAFKGIGSTTNPPVAVNVAVNACPSGLNSIQYEFIPVNAVLDSTNGVLALSSDSTATGIGLQLKDSSGNALKYNTQYTLTSYNTSTGGSYTIPLKAAYYQTAATVKPGSANAVLTFTMMYQ
ncbi:fimbrial protein [Burkholderia stagnalis]|uniref:fimbrial protein n=1 Tax=Burkholderia stagnalis TaxID=1503054 RepID=UPI000F814F35|nr:fimbrial protein [Burkholderia stagnalis]